MTRLSTGSRINSARDDAAGLAISERMSSQISGLNMALEMQTMLFIASDSRGCNKEIRSMLGRMRELAVQAAREHIRLSDQSSFGS